MSTTYTVKGVFNYEKWIRLENPIPGEKDINIDIKDTKILKYGSGLLSQLVKEDKGDKIDKKDIEMVKKLNKKDMNRQMSIDDVWN